MVKPKTELRNGSEMSVENKSTQEELSEEEISRRNLKRWIFGTSLIVGILFLVLGIGSWVAHEWLGLGLAELRHEVGDPFEGWCEWGLKKLPA